MKILSVFLILFLCPSLLPAQYAAESENVCQSYLTIQGFGINSLGNFKEDWKDGAGGYVGYGLIYPSHWGLTFQTGYITFKENAEANLGTDPSFTIIPIMAGGRYYILLDRVRPFLTAMSGFNLVSEKSTREGHAVDEFLVKLGFQIGVGVQVGLFSNLAVEVAGKYNSHLLNPNVPYNATGLEYGVALNWTLGR